MRRSLGTHNKDVYKWVKIAGLLAYIPFLLIAGPWAGYTAGEYIDQKFHLGSMAILAGFGLGMASAVVEVIRIVKLTLKIDKGSA